MQAAEAAAVRQAVSAAPPSSAAQQPGRAVEHDHERVDRGQPARAILGEDAHELDTRPSSPAQ